MWPISTASGVYWQNNWSEAIFSVALMVNSNASAKTNPDTDSYLTLLLLLFIIIIIFFLTLSRYVPEGV